MEIFQTLYNKNIDTAFLQETHITPEATIKWGREWIGKSLRHSGPILKASGVPTLFKENLKISNN